jgi:hypothetical protein
MPALTGFGRGHSSAENVLGTDFAAVRERPCSFKLPPISTAAEAAACMALVLEGMASGEILAGEGAALSTTINAYVKVFEATEIEARISALEAREKIAEVA